MQVKAFQFSSSNDNGLIYNAFIQYYKNVKSFICVTIQISEEFRWFYKLFTSSVLFNKYLTTFFYILLTFNFLDICLIRRAGLCPRSVLSKGSHKQVKKMTLLKIHNDTEL